MTATNDRRRDNPPVAASVSARDDDVGLFPTHWSDVYVIVIDHQSEAKCITAATGMARPILGIRRATGIRKEKNAAGPRVEA
jgi:hypothetical protein